jgi:hypothetical protein
MMNWLNQWLCGLSGHEYIRRFERTDDTRRVYLECANCGKGTDGWTDPSTATITKITEVVP